MKKSGISFGVVLLFGVTALFLANCSRQQQGRDNGTPDGVAIMVNPTYTSIYNEVFSKKCSECHQPGGSATQDGVQIDFSNSTRGFTTIVNQNVSGISSAGLCAGAKIVGADASHSYLLSVFFPEYGLGSSSAAGVSGCTPYDHTAFQTSVPTAAEKAALVGWLNAGAPNN